MENAPRGNGENSASYIGENNTSHMQKLDPWEEMVQKVKFVGGEKVEKEPRFIKLEDLESVCSLDNCAIFGHGTGSSGNGHDTVEHIFNDGLKGFESLGSMVAADRNEEISGSTDLMDNTVGIYTSLDGDFNNARLEEKLNNWPHRNSENIILMRLPLEYFHTMTTIPSERSEAFYTVHEDKNGHKNHYLDRRLILGNYNVSTGMVELNKYFEPEISGDFKNELEARLKVAQEKTEERNKVFEENGYKFTGNAETEETEKSEPDGGNWLSDVDDDWE